MQSFCFLLHLLIYSSWRHFVFCYFRPLTLFPAAALFSYFYFILFDLILSDFITSARPPPPKFFIFFCFRLNVWVRSCATSKWMLFICVAYTSSCTGKKKACLFTNVIWWAGSLLNSGKLLLMPLENRDNAANLNYRKNVKKKKNISVLRDNQQLKDHILYHMLSLFYCPITPKIGIITSACCCEAKWVVVRSSDWVSAQNRTH